MEPYRYVFKIELSEPGSVTVYDRFTVVCESFDEALDFAKSKLKDIKVSVVDIARIERMSVVDN